jgi:ubiquinone/menaquinone biosynthesis C-methylase UbiE
VNPEEYDKMRRLEDHYWWFVARRTLCIELWRRHAPRGLVLDVGCGTGAVAQELSHEAEVVGLDYTHLALRHAQGRGLTRLIQADGARLPVRDASVAGVVALDIFEHIEDDTAAFAEAARVLQPGGVLVLSVPAYRWLWGPHDVALHHFRRHTRGTVRRQLVAAGLEPVLVSYSVFWLFPLVLAERLVGKFRRGPARASLPPVPGGLNRALVALMAAEGRALRTVRWPWGSSVVAVARRPD